MPSPFPGMDPYLEHPDIWPDVHNRLIAAIGDALGPVLRPRYYVALEERVYIEEPPEQILAGRPDLTVVARSPGPERPSAGSAPVVAVVEVQVPDRVRETYLEVRGVDERDVVTVIEVLSPTNKRSGEGRRLYLDKRRTVFGTLTSLVEIDLLRSGERMPVGGARPDCDYSILVSRSWRRPSAHLVPFGVRDRVPAFPVPLRREEEEPPVDLGVLLASLYDRAGYDLRVRYDRPAQPPLRPEDAAWANALFPKRA